ncbi:MAG: hypothetical protein WD934_09215 [Gemmatimonadales bacterium]
MSTRHESDERIDRLVRWVQDNRRLVSMIGTATVVLAGGIWFTMSARERRELFAERGLIQARATAQAGNLPLATSDLQRLISRYGGTRSGQEAALTLAEYRLSQGQDDLAAAEMQSLVREARSQFRDQAYATLGIALEQSGQPGQAGQAYMDGAAATRFDVVAVQLLVAAGRAYAAAGDTAAAAGAYERILSDHGESGAVVEARLRLAELRRAGAPS